MRLIRDESGAVISAELTLILAVLVAGLVVGFTSLRNVLVDELTEVTHAIRGLGQSYSYAEPMREDPEEPCLHVLTEEMADG